MGAISLATTVCTIQYKCAIQKISKHTRDIIRIQEWFLWPCLFVKFNLNVGSSDVVGWLVGWLVYYDM